MLIRIGLLIFCLGCVSHAAAQETAGKAVFARGAVSAQVPGGELRILGKDAPIFREDVITVGPKSFGVVEFNDGTRMSLRPDTVFAIEDYNDDAGRESAITRLFKGGMRAISGYVSKRDPEAFEVNTAVATIGIRGTEFDARLCQKDECEAGPGQPDPDKGTTHVSKVVARIAYMKNEVTATNAAGEGRTLVQGGPLYQGDKVQTGADSYALIVFRDEGRVTLKADSVFKIEEFEFDADSTEAGSSTLRLIKGGLRALTGLISERDPDAYRVETATATVGIRGTGFDLLWLGPCPSPDPCGLVVFVWIGEISAANQSGIHGISLDQVRLIRFITSAPEDGGAPPEFTEPRPDQVQVDFEALFGAATQSGTPPGLYVACYEGHCTLFQPGRSLDLGAGETGYASLDGQILIRLERIDPFQADDPYLKTISELFDTLYELLDDNVIRETQFECVVQ